jgi:hypothetical protein
MPLHTCVSPKGRFIFGIHKPSFLVANQRGIDHVESLGLLDDQSPVTNKNNFPADHIDEKEATWIYEIPNPFPFRGTTFIKKDWADRKATDPTSIKLPAQPDISLSKSISRIINSKDPDLIDNAFHELPQTVLLAMATTSNDPADLIHLAKLACPFQESTNGEPKGLRYTSSKNGRPKPLINDHALFEALVNNPYLPDNYKTVMVLRPGAQGDSEIIGEFSSADRSSHVYEYLRRNSYIAWGHFASNMADDAVRYSIASLGKDDMSGLRHLYYQRTFIRLATELGIDPPPAGRTMTGTELEELRRRITAMISESPPLSLSSTLWGWNYGFDFAPSCYRLHASHQQIHQQYAMLPDRIPDNEDGEMPAYGCGDLVADFTKRFHQETGRSFFELYLQAIRSNCRIDGQKEGPASLIVHEDENVMLFVPKAQTSQWELQLICLDQVGNILEADRKTRESLDLAILTAMKVFDSLGVRMVTTIEFPKRFDSNDRDQRLLYSFLPKLPESPGAFSEAQLRWINGHYPEDFAFACREARKQVQI